MKNALLLVAILFLTACNKDEDEADPIDYSSQNRTEIINYIEVNNLTAQSSSSGLYYVIETLGSGSQPTSTSNVTVAYKGYYTNGTVFDESNSSGISFNLQQVIKGWQEGIPYFKEGGRGILLVPSHLGYGSTSRNGIPGGSVLVFDINLISVN